VIDTQQYGPLCHQLITTAPPSALGPEQPNHGAADVLQSMDIESIGNGRPVSDREMAACCRSGLWLLHNFLDESHTISQDIGSSTGSYWHAIMHRREPDYGNAKYWFRRVDGHPVYEEVAALVETEHPSFAAEFLVASAWDPYGFVDACQRANQDDNLAATCRAIGQIEWLALYDYCYRAAFID
jgi:hypothetical protein